MPGVQTDIFDPKFAKPLFSFFKFSKGPLRFMLQYHEATNDHFDLRLYHISYLLSFAIYKSAFQNSAKCKCRKVKDHDLKTFTNEGYIADGPGKGANVISDVGFIKLDNLPRKSGPNRLQKVLSDPGEVKIRFYGKKLTGDYILSNTGTVKYDTEIWTLEKPNDHSLIRDLDRSIITNRTPLDYKLTKDFVDPALARRKIEIIADQLLRDNNLG